MDAVTWPLPDGGVARIESRMDVLPDMVWPHCEGCFPGRFRWRLLPVFTADSAIS